MKSNYEHTFFIQYLIIILLLSSSNMLSLGQVEKDLKKDVFNIDNMQSKAISLVDSAVDFIKDNTIEKAASLFEKDDKWFFGDMSILLLNNRGIILVDGSNINNVWKDLSNSQISSEREAWNTLKSIKSEGQWVSFFWKNALRSNYVRKIEKDNQEYIVCTGFFSDSDRFTAKQLVEKAANIFYNLGPIKTWTEINNPFGDLVKGDIGVFAYDINGMKVADSINVSLIGQDLRNIQDTNDKFYVREMINIANSLKGQGWVSYNYRSADAKAFVKKVVDEKTGKSYILGASYYPTLKSETVKELVDRAAVHLRVNGTLRSFSDFNDRDIHSNFNYGPLSIFVYDLNGKVLVDTENPELTGQNIINMKDNEGYLITKDIIDKARKSGSGWITYNSKNHYKLVYITLVNTSEGEFIVGSRYFTDSKHEQVIALVERAMSFLKDNDKYLSFNRFTDTTSNFFKGDLSVFVYTPKGTALANGDNKMVIWDNFIEDPTYKDRVIIDDVIELAKSGGGWLDYKIRNSNRRVYAKLLIKTYKSTDGELKKESYIVGSGYFN